MRQKVLTRYVGEFPLHSYVEWERKGSQCEAAKAGRGLILSPYKYIWKDEATRIIFV